MKDETEMSDIPKSPVPVLTSRTSMTLVDDEGEEITVSSVDLCAALEVNTAERLPATGDIFHDQCLVRTRLSLANAVSALLREIEGDPALSDLFGLTAALCRLCGAGPDRESSKVSGSWSRLEGLEGALGFIAGWLTGDGDDDADLARTVAMSALGGQYLTGPMPSAVDCDVACQRIGELVKMAAADESEAE